MSSAFFYTASHTSRTLPLNPYKFLAFGCMLSCLIASIFCEIWELHICVRSLLMKLFSRGLPRQKILYFDTFRLFHSFRQGFCILLTLGSWFFFLLAQLIRSWCPRQNVLVLVVLNRLVNTQGQIFDLNWISVAKPWFSSSPPPKLSFDIIYFIWVPISYTEAKWMSEACVPSYQPARQWRYIYSL